MIDVDLIELETLNSLNWLDELEIPESIAGFSNELLLFRFESEVDLAELEELSDWLDALLMPESNYRIYAKRKTR